MLYIVLCAASAYLIGSINASVIISKKYYGKDIRTQGSGNAGATNTLRSFGKKAAAAVFIFDFSKGLLTVAAAKCLILFLDAPYECMLVAGFFVQFGHCFPLFFRFRGGKGVATAAGAAIGIIPLAAVIMLALFAVITLSTKIVSLASGICAAIYPLLAFFVADKNQTALFVFAAACSALIIVMHGSNFARLIDGKEKPVSSK